MILVKEVCTLSYTAKACSFMKANGHDAAADLSESETLDNQQLLDHLRTRYEASECCTVVGGAALLAINPHKPLRARTMDSYVDTRLSSTVAPHAYALAEEAFQQVCEADAAVAVLLTGESGAGKSRQAQQLIDYWCWRADGCQPRPSGGASVTSCLAKVGTLLGAMGCAPTHVHSESSRFCHLLQLRLERPRAEAGAYRVVGAEAAAWLLEHQRVAGGRGANYRVMYAACSAPAVAPLVERPTALLDDSAPSASLSDLKARSPPTRPTPPPLLLGTLPRPRQLASGRPVAEFFWRVPPPGGACSADAGGVGAFGLLRLIGAGGVGRERRIAAARRAVP